MSNGLQECDRLIKYGHVKYGFLLITHVEYMCI